MHRTVQNFNSRRSTASRLGRVSGRRYQRTTRTTTKKNKRLQENYLREILSVERVEREMTIRSSGGWMEMKSWNSVMLKFLFGMATMARTGGFSVSWGVFRDPDELEEFWQENFANYNYLILKHPYLKTWNVFQNLMLAKYIFTEWLY